MISGVTYWIAFGPANNAPPEKGPAEVLSGQAPAFSVRVRRQEARSYVAEQSFFGHTEASREVVIRSETSGPVVRRLVAEGDFVEEDVTIAVVAPQDRTAVLKQAEASLRLREAEHKIAQSLIQQGHRPEIEQIRSSAALESAKASLTKAQEALARTIVRAPFSGILESWEASVGDFLRVGDPVAEILQLDPLKVVVQVSEKERLVLQEGTSVRVDTGKRKDLPGVIVHLAHKSDDATRSFRMDVQVGNADLDIPAGSTALVRAPLPAVLAHVIPQDILILNDEGRLGVRGVDSDQRVVFYPISQMDSMAEETWVRGLPEEVTLITVGQGFVHAGQKVLATPELAEDASFDEDLATDELASAEDLPSHHDSASADSASNR